MPYDPNDDVIIRGGPLSRWLRYRIMIAGRKVPGWAMVALVSAASYVVGKWL